MCLCAQVDLQFLDEVISGGADPNCSDRYGQTVLHEVTAGGLVYLSAVLSCAAEPRCVSSGVQSVERRCDAVLFGPRIGPSGLGSVRSHSAARGLGPGLRGHGPVPPGPRRSVGPGRGGVLVPKVRYQLCVFCCQPIRAPGLFWTSRPLFTMPPRTTQSDPSSCCCAPAPPSAAPTTSSGRRCSSQPAWVIITSQYDIIDS